MTTFLYRRVILRVMKPIRQSRLGKSLVIGEDGKPVMVEKYTPWRILYNEYMESGRWEKVRARRLELDKHKCNQCGGGARLQVHHLSYKHIGKEPMSDLITLCYTCHMRQHRRFRIPD